jgi:hypothetical protein
MGLHEPAQGLRSKEDRRKAAEVPVAERMMIVVASSSFLSARAQNKD